MTCPLFWIKKTLIMIVALWLIVTLLQSMINSRHAYEQNKASTKHIVDAMMKALEEKLELVVSIPRKLQMNGTLLSKLRLKIMSVLLCVTWVLVFLQFRNLYVMCLVLPILKNVLSICTWRILLLKSLWEELMMFLFLQIGIMCP